MTNWLLTVNDWMLQTCNKEGIAIFVVFSVAVFAMATMMAVWAKDSGQFTDLEAAKFEMMEEAS